MACCARADVIRLVVNDTIQPISQEFISRAIDKAKTEKAEAVLIELRTPGGMLSSTEDIVEKILASEAPVIVFVTPSGGSAASAGFFLLQAADVAAMSPGTHAGAAHPVLGYGVKVDDVMRNKMQNDAAAFMRSFVAKRGRNVEAAEAAVRESKSYTEQEALEKKLIEVVATDYRDLLQRLDGREITRFSGTKAKLDLSKVRVIDFEQTLRQRMLSVLMNPGVTFLLFAIGLMLIYFEFNHPGGIVPGVVGVILVLLSIFALNILPTRFGALALIVGAFVLFALEVKYTSYGLLGIGGTVMMIVGALLLVDGPIPQMRVGLVTALAVSIPLSAITIFLMTIAYRAHQNKVVTGEQGMVGLVGEARTALAPRGSIFVNGELWTATSTAPIQPGTPVIVRSVRGLELEVEAVNGGLTSTVLNQSS